MHNMNLMAEVDMNSVFNNGMSLSERLLDGGRMIIIGVCTVFAVLFIIWLLLTVFRFFVYDIPRMREGKSSDNNAPSGGTSAGGSVSACVAVPADEANGQLIAVITAAIEAYRAQEGDGALPFRVVSFRRRNQGRPWNR